MRSDTYKWRLHHAQCYVDTRRNIDAFVDITVVMIVWRGYAYRERYACGIIGRRRVRAVLCLHHVFACRAIIQVLYSNMVCYDL